MANWLRYLRGTEHQLKATGSRMKGTTPMLTGPRSKRKFKLIPVQEPEIYPLLICVSLGVVLLGVYNVHNLSLNPDINIERKRRETQTIERYDPEEAHKFTQHRAQMASLRPNPGNAEASMREQLHGRSSSPSSDDD